MESGDENRPFVCEILMLYKTGFRPKALVQWYYWPEETSSGRLRFHGDRELFRSDHRDWIEVSTIINSCKIYSFVEYEVRESRTDIQPTPPSGRWGRARKTGEGKKNPKVWVDPRISIRKRRLFLCCCRIDRFAYIYVLRSSMTRHTCGNTLTHNDAMYINTPMRRRSTRTEATWHRAS